jgi:1,4-dihydroxy-2-naphthoate octaprenyltransferase
MPVVIGTAWAYAVSHRFSFLLFALALAATVLAHAAANVYNDVGDDLNGADVGNSNRIYPYTGGSRFIQAELLSRREMTQLAVGLGATALLLGILLALVRGPGVILLGLMGLGLGVLYSLPGTQLSARGLGEAAVALSFGPLPLLGAAWLQSASVDLGAVLICTPVGAWAAAILIINEVPDIDADRAAHKRTLVVRWGASGARRIYWCLTLIALVASFAAIMRGALPRWYALASIAAALAGLWAARGISTARSGRPRMKQSIEVTLAIHAIGCIVIALAVLFKETA